MQDIGISVGEWSDNENVNFMGGFMKPNNELILITSAKNSLKKEGLTSSKISEYLKKYQREQRNMISTFSPSKFIAYALEQNQKEYDALQESNSKNDVEAMNDLNLFPPKPNNSPIPNELMGDNEKDSQPNYLVYWLIGLCVVVGAFLIFKKK